MKTTLFVDGVPIEAMFPDETVETVLYPLVRRLEEIQRQRLNRLLVAFSAPPGAGKSTLARFLETLSPNLQTLPMDGFHRHQDYLLSHFIQKDGKTVPMTEVKGAPETFDLPHLTDKLNALRSHETLFPVYDRTRHDVIEDAVSASAPIILMEGIYLLLDEPGWRDLPFDYTIFMEADEDLLKSRVLARRRATGHDEKEAQFLYDTIDRPNILLCSKSRRSADLTLRLHRDGTITTLQEAAKWHSFPTL